MGEMKVDGKPAWAGPVEQVLNRVGGVLTGGVVGQRDGFDAFGLEYLDRIGSWFVGFQRSVAVGKGEGFYQAVADGVGVGGVIAKQPNLNPVPNTLGQLTHHLSLMNVGEAVGQGEEGAAEKEFLPYGGQ